MLKQQMFSFLFVMSACIRIPIFVHILRPFMVAPNESKSIPSLAFQLKVVAMSVRVSMPSLLPHEHNLTAQFLCLPELIHLRATNLYWKYGLHVYLVEALNALYRQTRRILHNLRNILRDIDGDINP